MKDYRIDINLNSVNNLINLAYDKSYHIEQFEGSLLDNYIIYDTEKIRMGKIKPRKFIILKEKYLNEWSSITEMIMTDNDNVVKEYEKLFTGN